MMNDLKLSASTFAGLEQVLSEELLQLGAKNIKIGHRNVQFEGDLGFLYKANYNLHTALRVFLQLKEFKFIKTGEQLYRAISKIDWNQIFGNDKSFRIDVSGKSEAFRNTQFIALKAKDALVDQFRKNTGKRPDVNIKNPDIRIRLHFDAWRMQVLLDSSGESLHKRGYRSATNLAPINEVLAAGIVKISGWQAQNNFLDPMCGSGTLPIEAAMLAMNIPASINREKFAFMNWKNFDSDLWKIIKKSSFNKIKDLPTGIKISGYDKAPSAVEKSIQNIKNAGLEDFIKIKQADFFKTIKPEQPVTLIFNPPYNERLTIDVQHFYKKIGDTLKHHYPDTIAWILMQKDALKWIGLRPSKKIPLYNGKIEVRMAKFEMYSGRKWT